MMFASELKPRREAVCEFAEENLEDPPAENEEVAAPLLEPTAD
jgi:hypothetical protein